ncbi:hypothetical protein ACGF0K_21695 [Streptomyces sp. NPDC048156]|uniref:hypothetical protein n=1 Tax=Streptomyces sp. NPDC048156 TaxID=3365502 RepID=UPI00371ACF7D
MSQISSAERRRNEEAIRAAMDRFLRGEPPPGGRGDVKTPAAEAGVNRTGFYPKSTRTTPCGTALTSTLPTSSCAG